MSLSMRIFPDLAACNTNQADSSTTFLNILKIPSLIVGISVHHIKLEELLTFLICRPVDEALAAESALSGAEPHVKHMASR